MRFKPVTLFTLSMALVFGSVVLTAMQWPPETRRFPLMIGIPILVLCLIQLVIEIQGSVKSSNSQEDSETMDLQVDWSIPNRLIAYRAANFFGWLVALSAGIGLLGFLIAMPVFNFTYIKLQARRRWGLSLSLGIATVLLIIVFDKVLDFVWPVPLLTAPDTVVRRLLRLN